MRDYLTNADPDKVISINNEEDIIIIKSKTDNIMGSGFHHCCGGVIDINNNGKYKVIICRVCLLRIKFPSNIETDSELKKYFEKKIPKPRKVTRAELIDLDY